ncbi:MAG: P-II family nitrogen regulator [Anaerotignaceae bacterium]
MKGIIIITRNEALERVQKILNECNAGGITVSKVMGSGRMHGYAEPESVEITFDMKVNLKLTSKTRIEVIVNDEDVENIIDKVCDVAFTGKYGDGKIFVYDVLDAVRIRTKERGKDAIS